MRITLAERQFSEQIRQLEGLAPEVTVEEIQHRIDKYARRLFEHISNFGVQMLQDGFQVSGTLCTMSASLKQSYSEEDVQTRVNGLALLAPLSVSLDATDLAAFVPNQIMLASMAENWAAFGQSLQRLSLSEVRPALENAARQLLSAPVAAPSNSFEAMQQEQGYELFLARAGKRDPLARHNAVEEYRQREEKAYAAQQQAAKDAFWNREEV